MKTGHKNTMTKTPQHILEKIEEVREKKLTKLTRFDFGYRELTEVPPEVFELDWLEELDLSYHNIRTIPNDILKLTKLKRIDVDSNPLDALPDIQGLIIDYKQYKKFRDNLKKKTS